MIKRENNNDVSPVRITSAEEYVKLQHCVLNENDLLNKMTSSLSDLHVDHQSNLLKRNENIYDNLQENEVEQVKTTTLLLSSWDNVK